MAAKWTKVDAVDVVDPRRKTVCGTGPLHPLCPLCPLRPLARQADTASLLDSRF
jgi:hypothetical protein